MTNKEKFLTLVSTEDSGILERNSKRLIKTRKTIQNMEAVAFGEWILNSPYTQGYDTILFWWNQNTDETYTTEELFQIYLNQK